MEKREMTRRALITQALPAAALAGVTVGSFGAAAQQPAVQAGEVMKQMATGLYRDGLFQLPPLPYAVDALEPHISAQIIAIHHDKHHQSYVTNLNKTLTEIKQLGQGGSINEAHLNGLQRDLSFNGGGHALHSLFWATMGPAPANGSNVPEGAIAEAITMNFGTFEQFVGYFTSAAAAVRGSGWAVLAYEPFSDGLGVFQVGDHDMRVVPGALPILTVDVWEHAYYLQYQNKRADFIKAWWNVVNWTAVNELLTFYRQQNHLTI